MKAHNKNFSIIPSIIVFTIIGLTTTEAVAQRRDNNNPDNRRNEQRVKEGDHRNKTKDYNFDHKKDHFKDKEYSHKKYGDNIEHRHNHYNNKNWDDHKNWNHHPVSFRKLPRKAVMVQLDGDGYIFYKGNFYMASPFGYYRVDPPQYLRVLPRGCHRVWVNNHPMFRYNDILFVETPFGFKIMI